MGAITLRARLQDVAIMGTQLYVTKPIQYSKIGERELLQMASENSGVNIAMIRATFDALVLQMREMILNGHSINIEDLGTFQFSVRCKACDDPRDISVSNVKRRGIKFRPSKVLRDQLKRITKTLEIVKEKEKD